MEGGNKPILIEPMLTEVKKIKAKMIEAQQFNEKLAKKAADEKAINHLRLQYGAKTSEIKMAHQKQSAATNHIIETATQQA